MGLVSACLWQRYHRIKLPPYLAFFGGRRFVPIITAFAAMVISVLMSFVYPAFDWAITGLGEWVTENAVLGGFVYGTLNRLLIPLGLHHILNNPPWFIFGEYTDGRRRDRQRRHRRGSWHGDPTAGAFMTGFFPIMMFALPGRRAGDLARGQAAAARRLVGGIMLSAALTSFLTGVTEPLEFAFMFVAWPLYVIHALLTGTSMALINALGIKDGFGFSAGLFDYVLNCNIATKPLLAHPDRAGLRGALLLPVPVRDPEVEPADARVARRTTRSRWWLDPRAGQQGLTCSSPHDRWSPRRGSSRRGGCSSTATAIAEVGAGAPPRAPDVDLGDATVVPGFVDIHVHGGGGRVVRRRYAGRGAAVVADAHLAHGTTSMVGQPGHRHPATRLADAVARARRARRTTACSPASTSRDPG